jgi:ribosomal-protein-alanine N-acetyltransferase
VTEGRAVLLREAGAAFAPLLAALHARSFPAPWSTSSFAALLAAPGVTALIAVSAHERDEAPLGFIVTRLAAGEAEVLTMCVLSEERDNGIGRRLLDAACSALRAQEAKAVFLEVGLGNVAARRLYERAGFVEVGRRRGYYQSGRGPAEDALSLRLAL